MELASLNPILTSTRSVLSSVSIHVVQRKDLNFVCQNWARTIYLSSILHKL